MQALIGPHSIQWVVWMLETSQLERSFGGPACPPIVGSVPAERGTCSRLKPPIVSGSEVARLCPMCLGGIMHLLTGEIPEQVGKKV